VSNPEVRSYQTRTFEHIDLVLDHLVEDLADFELFEGNVFHFVDSEFLAVVALKHFVNDFVGIFVDVLKEDGINGNGDVNHVQVVGAVDPLQVPVDVDVAEASECT